MELDNYLKQITGSRYNGRANIIENPDPTAVFKMQERIALKNKSICLFIANIFVR